VGIQMMGRFEHPNVFVDNTNSSVLDFDEVDEINDELPYDNACEINYIQVLNNHIKEAIAFSQEIVMLFYILDYTLKRIIELGGEQD
jgi:hypothetical protein